MLLKMGTPGLLNDKDERMDGWMDEREGWMEDKLVESVAFILLHPSNRCYERYSSGPQATPLASI